MLLVLVDSFCLPAGALHVERHVCVDDLCCGGLPVGVAALLHDAVGRRRKEAVATRQTLVLHPHEHLHAQLHQPGWRAKVKEYSLILNWKPS